MFVKLCVLLHSCCVFVCDVACLASRLFCLSVMLALSSQYCSCFGVNHSVIYFILTSWTLLHMSFPFVAPLTQAHSQLSRLILIAPKALFVARGLWRNADKPRAVGSIRPDESSRHGATD